MKLVKYLIIFSITFISFISCKPSILLPLYSYPENNVWQPIFDGIKNNPSVKFDIIVNPENGPGNSIYPDSDYIENVSKLNGFKNVRCLGYVHTSYGKRNASAVNEDITKYRNWKNYSKKNITIKGIFFDETPEKVNFLSYMTGLSNFAKIAIPNGYNIFNPGVMPPKSFFNIADSIVVYEDVSAHFGNDTLNKFSGLESKSSIIINKFTKNAAIQNQLVIKISKAGIQSLLITTDPSYDNFSKLWPQFCTSVAKAST